MPDREDVITLARELQEKHDEVVSFFVDGGEAWRRPSIEEALEEYHALRRRLKIAVGEMNVVVLPGAEYAGERRTIQNALANELPLDWLHERVGVSSRIFFEIDELEPIAEEYLSWFSQYDYARARLESAVLVLNAGDVPEIFSHYVREVQECFAFQRYTAVYALSRTTLEAGLLPIYQQNRLDKPDSENAQRVRSSILSTRSPDWRKRHLTEDKNLFSSLSIDDFSPSLDQMITRLCWLPRYSAAKVREERLRDVLHRIRDRGNSLIHGRRTADRATAKEMMHDLFRSLHVIYEVEPHE